MEGPGPAAVGSPGVQVAEQPSNYNDQLVPLGAPGSRRTLALTWAAKQSSGSGRVGHLLSP